MFWKTCSIMIVAVIILTSCTGAPGDATASPPAPAPTTPPTQAAPPEQPTPPQPLSEDQTVKELQTKEGQDFAANELIITLAPGANEDELMKDYNLTLLHKIEALGMLAVRTPGSAVDAWQALKNDARVTSVAFNYYAKPQQVTPNDPNYSKQWGLPAIAAPAGWQRSTGSPDIAIAVVDSGVDLNHPDLAGKLLPGYDFVEWDETPQDENGHGTHVAGIAAAASNNAVGISGVAWGTRIIPVRVMDAEGKGSMFSIAAGIVWSVDHGAKIVNLSLGTDIIRQLTNILRNELNDPLRNAVQYAHARGALVVVAAGNDYDVLNIPPVPASYPNVLAVGAVGQDLKHAGFSNGGNYVDVVAPGVDILSTMPTYEITLQKYVTEPGYGQLKGTSQATPFVSGLAALVWSVNPKLTPDQVQGIIESTATQLGAAGLIGEDPCYGAGLINVDAALAAASGGQATAPSDHGEIPLPGLCGLEIKITPLPTIDIKPMPMPTIEILPIPTLPPIKLP